jgi:hypothetical protein
VVIRLIGGFNTALPLYLTLKTSIDMHIWEVLSNEGSWSKNFIAETNDGYAVKPHDPRAVKHSIPGALIYCYLQADEIWNTTYESYRSKVFYVLMSTPALRKIIRANLEYSTFKDIPLQELNRKVDYQFVQTLMSKLSQC